MDYNVCINGIETKAVFSEENINEIFLPLLRKLKKMSDEKGERILIMLAAPPGSGKSTLVEFLKHLSKSQEDLDEIDVVGMDGFHRYQDYLVSHTIKRNGIEIPMVNIKGAPFTFDFERLEAKIEQVKSIQNCKWPIYNRMTHNPQEDAIDICRNIVLLEGNYLLLDFPKWQELSRKADYTISISADPQMLRTRLIERKMKSGCDIKTAEEFVDFSDMVNVDTCLRHSKKADLMLEIDSKGRFTVVP